MPRTPLRLVLAATMAAVLLASCGSSGGDGAADGPTTTKAESSTTAAPDETTTTEASETTTTEAAATTTTAKAGGKAICAPLKDLSAKDAQANELVAGGDWVKIKAFYVDQTDDIIAIYDEAIALDTEITPALKTLRQVTVSAGDLAESSTGLMEFGSKLAAQPGISASSDAALKANEFATKTCGFPLAGF